MFFFHAEAAPKLCTIYLVAYVCDFGRIHFVVMYSTLTGSWKWQTYIWDSV